MCAQAALLCLAIFTSAVSCRPRNPLDEKVAAATPLAFMQWRARYSERLSPAEKTEFDAMVQELRFKIMADGGTTGSEGVDTALRERVAGHTVRELLRLGYEAKLGRLYARRVELETFILQNSQLRTKAGDVASAQYLDGRHEEQSSQLKAVAQEIAAASQRLGELGGVVPPAPPRPAQLEAAPRNRVFTDVEQAGGVDEPPVMMPKQKAK